jgi:hypothetical protein
MTPILKPEKGKPSAFNYQQLMKKPIEPYIFRLVGDW